MNLEERKGGGRSYYVFLFRRGFFFKGLRQISANLVSQEMRSAV